MYDVRQFKVAIYWLVLVGITGFAMAAESPAIWALSASAILLNAWLVNTSRFKPMPRGIANGVTVLGVLLLALMMQQGGDTPILIVGNFLIFLQVVKLYEQRSNRDYAQLVVLSLLLMVAAAISTASIVFGVVLTVYVFLSLYTCLLLHLKVESERARHAAHGTEEPAPPAARRKQRNRMSQSMRRLTGLLALFALSGAVLTFLFFPRGATSGLLGPLHFKPGQVLSGFSDSVSFQNVARISQNTTPVAWVQVQKNGQPYMGLLRLRGLTLDRYTGPGDETGDNAYQWIRSTQPATTEEMERMRWRALQIPLPRGTDIFHQHIRLEATGSTAVFALPGATRFRPYETGRYRYSRPDEIIQSSEPINHHFEYEVDSTGELKADPAELSGAANTPISSGDDASAAGNAAVANNAADAGARPQERYLIDPKIEQFARRPEVSGTDAQGPLAARRPKKAMVTPLDALIARNMENYLRTNFTYTLDLTDAARIEGQDPLVAFLYDLKRGHCEYFAGAMTLMCQSLGMQARMVVGFMCDEYNPIGDYYQVRQSHAHAWVEVLDDKGIWQTYDPTSSREATAIQRTGFLSRASDLLNYVEYSWQQTVILYDRDARSAVIAQLDQRVGQAMLWLSRQLRGMRAWCNYWLPIISLNLIAAAVVLALLLLFISITWFAWERWSLRKRAHRIGLDVLPESDQIELARRLGFYDDLLRLLERFRIVRPKHLTPLEFSESLTFLPVDSFSAVRLLTDAFYRVRYGRAVLSDEEQRRLAEVIGDVEASLDGQN